MSKLLNNTRTVCRRMLPALVLLSLLLCTVSLPGWTQVATTENYPEAYIPKNIPQAAEEDAICFALYTVHNNILKLNAQLYPLPDNASRTVRLEIAQEGDWKEIARTQVIEDGWTAPFRVVDWDSTKTVAYRVAHGDAAYFTGTIRRDPIEKNEIVVAAFTGNSISKAHGGDIPRTDIVDNINQIDPDLLFFSGDQVYDHFQHLRSWLRFGEDFKDIIRNRPTITIPDDHDAGQANLWGEGGGKASTSAGDDGGYFAPAKYVKQVERAQTSHLPDPYDPTPVNQGIGVYYTSLNLGRISFGIIEDRKFKTGPNGVIPQQGPRPDHVLNPNYNPKDIDVPEAILLGKRQLDFLAHWSQDWAGADMKAVLSQTIFAGGAHIHGKLDGRLHADLDSNGWPQTGRNKALAEIRKGYALMIAGDQHLGTVIRHGIDEWQDAGYSFCVPSIANLYLRWWKPLQPGQNRILGAPEYTGDHLDGFDNKVTVLAAANPEDHPKTDDKLTTRAAGFGIVRFKKSTREIAMECWPRNVDVTASDTKQYPGWPITIRQEDNYGREAYGYLPQIVIEGRPNPVVQVIDESTGEIVYTLRINGNAFTPKVFKDSTYTIRVGEGSERKEFTNQKIQIDSDNPQTIQITIP